MIKVLCLFLLLALAACTMPAAQPFAALDNMPAKNTTSGPTTSAAAVDDTTPTPPINKPMAARCIVTAREWLNLRSDAGTFAPGVVVLAHGESVTMTGNQRSGWVEVATVGGVVGWVNSNYCKE